MNISVLFGVACIHAHTCTRAPGGTSLFGFTSQLGRTNMYSDTYLPTHPHTHIPTRAHTHARHRHARANIHHMRALAHADCACARALAQARIRTHARVRTHAHAHAHGHAHAHAHTRFLINSGSLVETLDCGKRIGPTPRICHSWQEQNNETTAPFEGTRGTQVRPEASLRMEANDVHANSRNFAARFKGPHHLGMKPCRVFAC